MGTAANRRGAPTGRKRESAHIPCTDGARFLSVPTEHAKHTGKQPRMPSTPTTPFHRGCLSHRIGELQEKKQQQQFPFERATVTGPVTVTP